MMTPKERKAALYTLRVLARCAEKAAQQIGQEREHDRIRDVIARNEREHRALGRQGLREDYVRGAILASYPGFLEAWDAEIFREFVLPRGEAKTPRPSEQGYALSKIRLVVENTDYVDLVGE